MPRNSLTSASAPLWLIFWAAKPVGSLTSSPGAMAGFPPTAVLTRPVPFTGRPLRLPGCGTPSIGGTPQPSGGRPKVSSGHTQGGLGRRV
jgi:hypothetical protein